MAKSKTMADETPDVEVPKTTKKKKAPAAKKDRLAETVELEQRIEPLIAKVAKLEKLVKRLYEESYRDYKQASKIIDSDEG